MLDNQSIQPLFRVPTCVLFARKGEAAVPVPDRALAFFGQPPRKDASETEIEGRIRTFETAAPGVVSYAVGSPYRSPIPPRGDLGSADALLRRARASRTAWGRRRRACSPQRPF